MKLEKKTDNRQAIEMLQHLKKSTDLFTRFQILQTSVSSRKRSKTQLTNLRWISEKRRVFFYASKLTKIWNGHGYDDGTVVEIFSQNSKSVEKSED